MIGFGLGFLAGLAACGAQVGLSIAMDAGADLARVLATTALLFLTAGLFAGGARLRAAAWSRGAGVVLGGAAPLVALAAAGIAYGGVWGPSLIAVMALMVAAGIGARRSWVSGGRWRAVAVAAGAAAVVGAGVQFALPPLLSRAMIERSDRPIEAVELVSFDGSRISSASWTGKVTVLAFWATWCMPCRAELPELQALHARFRDDPRVEFLAVNAGWGGDTLDAAREFARVHEWNLPTAFSEGGAAATALGVEQLPSLVLIDRSGRRRLNHRGYDRSEPLGRIIGHEIDRLLAEPTAAVGGRL